MGGARPSSVPCPACAVRPVQATPEYSQRRIGKIKQLFALQSGAACENEADICMKMDIKTPVTEVQKQTFQHLVEKIVANNNKFPPKEIESFRHLLENIRDTKNFQTIMEKFKSVESLESSLSDEISREGNEWCVGLIVDR